MVDKPTTDTAVQSVLTQGLTNRPVTVASLIATVLAAVGVITTAFFAPLGGSLTGSLPNPTIAAGAITQTMLAPGVGGSNLPVSINDYTGDGSTTQFTLSVAPGLTTTAIVGGVYQNASSYSVSGTTVTFGQAPPAGASIEVRVQ